MAKDSGMRERERERYVRSEDRTCEGEKSGVEGVRVGIEFDILAVCYKGDFCADDSVVTVGRRKCREVLRARAYVSCLCF